VLYVLLALVALTALLLYTLKPRLDRDWAVDHARLATATFHEGLVTVEDVRNFSWRTLSDFDTRWSSRTYVLGDIRSVDYVVVPFGKFQGMAHSFLTFGFDDGRHVSISVEIRREEGEVFGPIRGMFRQYELIYVVGDERDLIGLRANIRNNTVYLFPIRAARDQVSNLFVSMLRRANALAEAPEFYNTLVNNCATNILRHVNELLEDPHPYSLRVAVPGYSARYAYDHGLMDTEQSFLKARERFRINARSGWIKEDLLDPEGRAWSAQIRAAPAA
jgi:hypothetical protein